MAKQMATCTVMVMTDGNKSIYHVMVGTMTKRGSFKPITDVARYEVVGKPDYVAMTARHATVNAPAVSWQVQ